ncbi:hypothetical protein [Rubellicoccus peritrichatus]|uniref:Uncharacterized protein n=1 Tax=Rubellicoccus peritrichatus TaxID=3080537 RepID=A0AAQ3LCZ0_9BACT|nr:hypothetical protein [Puniceicoccus sp. CR14]WOO42172.1 hypothetical protein RZN69_03660 [Puniceicoccus sp. CR14]
MRIWILITAWTLIPFGIIGLLVSLLSLSIPGILINLALVAIGALDLRNLKRAAQSPAIWNHIALTQFALGLIIGGSCAYLGFTILETDSWQQATETASELLGNQPEFEQALEQSSLIMKWGLVIGGVIILISQIIVSIRLRRMTKLPPPLG